MTDKLTLNDYAEFRELLETEKNKLIKEALSLEDAKITISPEDLSDESDIATFEENQHLNLRLKSRERVLINKINKALQRIENKTYFDCEECDSQISKKRLLARPVTTMCIACKEAQEREEKLTGD